MSEHEAAETAVNWLTQPLQPILDHPATTDLHINGVGPGQAFVDQGKGLEKITLPYSLRDLENLALYSAAYTNQEVSEANPLCTTKLPSGQRVQIVLPPAVGHNKIAISLRQPQMETHTPGRLKADGIFNRTVNAAIKVDPDNDKLEWLLKKGDFGSFLEYGVSVRKNVVFSGDVGTGKTHCLRAYTHCIPKGTRIGTLEDVDEMINLPHDNVVHMFYSKGNQSIANVTADSLVEATKRMGFGCVLNQELRDEAAYSFMDVLDGGAFGMTTVHARSAGETRSRIRGLIKRHHIGKTLDESEISRMLYRTIDIIAFCVREGNQRFVKEILYDPERKAQYEREAA